jgi:hypothetical protein
MEEFLNNTKSSVSHSCGYGTFSWWFLRIGNLDSSFVHVDFSLKTSGLFFFIIKKFLQKGTLIIAVSGLFGNTTCFYLFSKLKAFKRSSYIYYLKLLCLSDTICLIVEAIKSTTQIFIYHNLLPHDALTSEVCKLIDFVTTTFHLFSAWLICAFSIERCMAVIWPLLIRQVFNIGKTKLICSVILLTSVLIQLNGLFLTQSKCSPLAAASLARNKSCAALECKCLLVNDELLFKVNLYFNQLTCLIVIPSVIVITCNSIVFYRIIKRRKMIDSGRMYNFKINQANVPTIRVTKCSTVDPEVIRKNMAHLQMLASSAASIKADSESANSCLNSVHEEEYLSVSTTCDDNRSVDSKTKNARIKKTKVFRERAKLNKDIKLMLLMTFSASFLVFVMPEGLLNIYEYHAGGGKMDGTDHRNNSFKFVYDLFYMLKLINYSSNFLAYFALTTFSKVKLTSLRNPKR